MGIAITLKEYLADLEIDYSEFDHKETGSSLATAAAAHIPGKSLVKAVLLSDGRNYLLAALPADRLLEISRLCGYLEQDYDLADEDEIGEIFGDCDLGAVPPVGGAYGVNVIWDDSLSGLDGVYFEGGDHKTLVRVGMDDFRKLMRESDHTTISRPM